MTDLAKVQDIVRAYLEDNGYDGLAEDDCGCWLNDLMPCGGDYSRCRPGYSDVAEEEESSYFEPGTPIMRPGKRPMREEE
jgi:hypothetical protein